MRHRNTTSVHFMSNAFNDSALTLCVMSSGQSEPNQCQSRQQPNKNKQQLMKQCLHALMRRALPTVFHRPTLSHMLQPNVSSGCRVDGALCSARSDSEWRSPKTRVEVESSTSSLKWLAFMFAHCAGAGGAGTERRSPTDEPVPKAPVSVSSWLHYKRATLKIQGFHRVYF